MVIIFVRISEMALSKFIYNIFLICLFCVTSVNSKVKLSDFSYNCYSQFGEDGIISKIFEIIGTDSQVCLEVGAGNGSLCGSNIHHLWKDLQWKAILIEGDPENLETLEPVIKAYNNCILVKAYIEKDEKLGKTIDSILYDLGINKLDLLSLDIDGNDYYIFENLKIHPRVLIVEFNPTIPYYRDVYQEYTNHSWDLGCSIAALKRLGKQKNYLLVAVTDVNAIFVDEIYSNKFEDFETSLEKICHTKYLKNIILSYSGDPVVVGKKNGLSDGFFKVGYSKKLNCTDCYSLRINEIDLNDKDLNKNFPGFPKIKPVPAK